MTAHVILLKNADGHESLCDQRCYDSPKAGCDCICKGVNHGVGFKQAIINTRGLWLFPDHIYGYVEKGPDKTQLYLHPEVLHVDPSK